MGRAIFQEPPGGLRSENWGKWKTAARRYRAQGSAARAVHMRGYDSGRRQAPAARGAALRRRGRRFVSVPGPELPRGEPAGFRGGATGILDGREYP